jgi:hypothetical protein
MTLTEFEAERIGLVQETGSFTTAADLLLLSSALAEMKFGARVRGEDLV